MIYPNMKLNISPHLVIKANLESRKETQSALGFMANQTAVKKTVEPSVALIHVVANQRANAGTHVEADANHAVE